MLTEFIWRLQPELAHSISLHYSRSISQTVSLVEIIESVSSIKSSRPPIGKINISVQSNRQKIRIGARDVGASILEGAMDALGFEVHIIVIHLVGDIEIKMELIRLAVEERFI